MSESESTTPFFTKTRLIAIIAAVVAFLGIVTAYLSSGDPVVETPAIEAPVIEPAAEPATAPEVLTVPISEENSTPALEVPAPTVSAE